MDSITTHYEDDLAFITMDDGKANAMDVPFLDALRAAFDGVEASDARTVVLRGRSGFFSAGLNVKKWASFELEERVRLVRSLSNTLLRVFGFPVPVVAEISGHALAGGALLALSADLRIAATGTYRFGTNEVLIGVDIPTFGLEIVRAAVPTEHLTEIVLHGTIYTPEEAFARRIFTSLVPPDRLEAEGRQRAEMLTRIVPTAYRATKERLRSEAIERSQRDLEEQVDDFIARLDRAQASQG